MGLDVSCPNCRSTFKVSEQHIGKQAKCPKCGGSFKIGSQPTEMTPPPLCSSVTPNPPVRSSPPPKSSQSQIATPQAESSTPSVASASTKERGSMLGSRRSVVVISALVASAFVVGYFAGREHVKYELRSAFAGAAEEFNKGLEEAFNFDALPEDSDSVSPGLAYADLTDEADNEQELVVAMGEKYATGNFALAVVDAKIDRPEVKDMFDDEGVARNPALKLTLRVWNTDERKILRFRENMFDTRFHLHDDVDNVIRGVNYGASSSPVGALSSRNDILPGQEATHVEVFSVPPPKTKHLILTVDLSVFGGHGEVNYMIPANRFMN